MRTFIGVLLTLLVLQACKQNKQGYHIEVNLDNAGGKWVKLLQVVDRNYVTYDSAFAEAGTPVILSRGIEGVQTMYLTLDDEGGSIRMLVVRRYFCWSPGSIILDKLPAVYIRRITHIPENLLQT